MLLKLRPAILRGCSRAIGRRCRETGWLSLLGWHGYCRRRAGYISGRCATPTACPLLLAPFSKANGVGASKKRKKRGKVRGKDGDGIN